MRKLLTLISIIILSCSICYAIVTDTTQRVQYTATSDQTLFAYTWRILDQDDLDVYVNGVITTSYSVSNVGEASGGNITFNSGRTSGDIVVVIRNLPETQPTSYPAGGRLSTVNLEKNLDRLTLIVQDLEEEIDRATKLPATSTQSNLDFPEGSSATDRATKVPAWNSAGTGLELIASTNVDATSVIATKGDTVVGSSSGTAAKLGIGNAGEIWTVSSGTPAWAQSRKVAWKKGTDIVGTTTTTIDIPNEDANYFDVTGTSTIVAIEAISVGSLVRFHFDDVGTLTHNATDLVLPQGNDIPIVAGSEYTFYEYQTGDYRLVGYGQTLEHSHSSVGTSTGGSISSTSIPKNYRSGFDCSQTGTGTIIVEAGIIDVDGTSVENTGTTTLTLETSTDWVSDVIGQTTSSYGFVYINASGDIELGATAPDEADTLGNTSGILRYNDTGTDTKDRRMLGWFFMNSNHPGTITAYEVGNLKDGDVHNSVVRTDSTQNAVDDNAYASDLTNTQVHFYSSGRGIVKITCHLIILYVSISRIAIVWSLAGVR